MTDPLNPVVLSVKKDDPDDLWHHDHLQFARLIAELGGEAQAFTPAVMDTLKREMDLDEDQIHWLITRAQATWDAAKQGDAPAVRQDDSTEDFVLLDSHPGVWITVNNISVRVIRADECVVVDLYAKGGEMNGTLATMAVGFDEAAQSMEEEEDDER